MKITNRIFSALPNSPVNDMRRFRRLFVGMVLLFSVGTFGRQEISASNNNDNWDLIEAAAVSEENKWTRDSMLAAIDLYDRCSKTFEAIGNIQRLTICLRRKSKLLSLIGEKKEAGRVLEKTLLLLEREHESEKAEILSDLALLAIASADTVTSDRRIASIDRLDQLAFSPDAQADVWFARAENSYQKRDIETAVEYYQKSAAVWSSQRRIKEEANCLLYLAYASLTLTNYSQGLIWSEEALKGFAEVGDRRGIALANVARGHLLTTTDNNQAALDAYKQAENLFPADVDRVDMARLFNGIGNIYEVYGLWNISLDYREKALELYRTEHYISGELQTLPLIAKLNYLLGNDLQALKYFERTQERAVRFNDEFFQAGIMEELADYYFYTKNYEKAKASYLTFLKSARRVGLKNQMGRSLVKLGLIFEMNESLTEAESAFLNSIAISRELLNPMTESDALFCLSTLTYKLGDAANALTLSKRSIELADSMYYKVANSSLKTTYFSNIFERYELYIYLLMQVKKLKHSEGDQVKGFIVAERSHAQSMLENLSLSENRFTADANADSVDDEKKIAGFLNAKADQMADLLSNNAAAGDIEKLRVEISALANTLEEMKADFKRKSPIYSAIKSPEPFDVSDFQTNVLDKNAVLVEFSLGKEESYLWVVSKAEVVAYYLPSRERIESRVERLRGLLQEREMRDGEELEEYQKRMVGAEVEYAAEARALSEELLGQVGDKLKGKRLIIVADGRLQYFPIGALPMPGSGSDNPILLTNEVVYSPSASALKLFKSENPTAKKPEKDLLVFADPVFSKSDDRLTGLDTANSGFVSTILGNFRSVKSLDDLARLPESEVEAKSISNEIGGFRTAVRSGFAANRESALNTDIADYKILHFATHGLIDEKRPELSGILLSLYDQNGKRNDGGFIRLQDVYGLNLRSDLVVLSACDTGIGKEVRGEGVMSLTNAFLQAGSKTVVSSLWKVDDAATKELMSEFYRGMASDGLTVASALRQAQIKLYNDPKFHSPFYWAAFTMQGDYDKVPQISTRFAKWTYLAAALCGVLLMFYLFRVTRELRVRTL